MNPGPAISTGDAGLSVPQTRDTADIVEEGAFLRDSRAEIDHALFLARFANWRLSVSGTVGIAWILGAMYHYLEPEGRTLEWAALETLMFGLIGAMCLAYERWRPAPGTRAQRRWLGAWTVATASAGMITGLLPWFLPAGRIELQLSAVAIVAILMISFVVTRGHRPLILAAVIAQTATLCLALGLHIRMPLAIGVCLMFAAFVLAFGLMLNGSMRAAIGQRLYAAHLHSELQRSQARRLLSERREAALRERTRMLSELHDGFGSQLLTAQRQLEAGALNAESAAGVLRECVVDLRLLIDAHEPAARNFATLLGMLRYRLQRRIESAGIRLRWEVQEHPEIGELTGDQALDLLRILQEAIANVLQHAGAREIRLVTWSAPHETGIRIEDDGGGFDPDAPPGGHGIAGMQRRATRLKARLEIAPRKGGGSVLSVRLPLHQFPVAARGGPA